MNEAQRPAPVTEQLPIQEDESSVSYLGVRLPKAVKHDSEFVPHREHYDEFINDKSLALPLQRTYAVSFLNGDPLLVEGGTSIGKTTTARKMAAELGWEVHYVNLTGATDVEDLMGRYIPNPNRSGPEDPEYIFADGKVTSGLRQEEGVMKVIVLDEFNAAAPSIIIRLHEVLDALERGENVVLAEDASETVPVNRERTKILALMNPPGKGYFGREPLDPAQLRRWVYHKAPSDLPAETFSYSTDALFSLSPATSEAGDETHLASRDAVLLASELQEIPGIRDVLAQFKEFHKGAKELVKNRKVAADQPQLFTFDDRMEPRRVRDFILRFYNGDITATIQEALRYYYANKLESPTDRAKLEELIKNVAYKPAMQDSKRRGLDDQAAEPAVVPGDALEPGEESTRKPITASEAPEATDLIRSEEDIWKTFLGKEIEIPPVPITLMTALEEARMHGIANLEPHYLPSMQFAQEDEHPGWEKKPEQWYWDQIAAETVPEDAPQIDGNWVLIDGTAKPDYEDGQQLYESDPYAEILAKLRKTEKIGGDRTDVPAESRAALSWDEIHAEVFAEIANTLKVPRANVRFPKAIEFNVLGNQHHPEWGGTNTWEWFQETFGSDGRLLGGGSDYGGLVGGRLGSVWRSHWRHWVPAADSFPFLRYLGT